MERFNFLETASGTHKYGRCTLQLSMTRDLKMILLLTNERIVRIRKIESFVGIDPIMRHRTERRERKEINLIQLKLSGRVVTLCAYSSCRLWSHKMCQFCCWNGENRMHCIGHDSLQLPSELPCCCCWLLLCCCSGDSTTMEVLVGGLLLVLRRVEIGESTIADGHTGLKVSGSGLIDDWTRWSTGVAGATDIDLFIGNSFICCCCCCCWSLILIVPFCRLRDSIICC